jgi:hypothetical protein
MARVEKADPVMFKGHRNCAGSPDNLSIGAGQADLELKHGHDDTVFTRLRCDAMRKSSIREKTKKF